MVLPNPEAAMPGRAPAAGNHGVLQEASRSTGAGEGPHAPTAWERNVSEEKARVFSFVSASTATGGHYEDEREEADYYSPTASDLGSLEASLRLSRCRAEPGGLEESEKASSVDGTSTTAASEEGKVEEADEEAEGLKALRAAYWQRRRAASELPCLKDVACTAREWGEEEEDEALLPVRAMGTESADFSAGARARCPTVLRTLSSCSIPEEWSGGSAANVSARCRGSSQVVLPASTRDEHYDPRSSAYIRPATKEEEAQANAELLRQQVASLQGMVTAREPAEPDSEVLRDYRRMIQEMQLELLSPEAGSPDYRLAVDRIEAQHRRRGSARSARSGHCGSAAWVPAVAGLALADMVKMVMGTDLMTSS